MTSSRPPEDFQQAFKQLDGEVVRLHREFDTYRALFSANESIDLLRRASEFTMAVIKDALASDISRGIIRLVDKSTIFGQPQVTLLWLADRLPVDFDRAERETFAAILRDIRVLTEPFRDHSATAPVRIDVSIRRGRLLRGMRLPDVAKVLHLMLAFVNAVHAHYGDATVQSTDVIQIGSTSQLLSVLQDGLALRDTRDRVRAGRMSLEQAGVSLSLT
jgi:hypothetical protein